MTLIISKLTIAHLLKKVNCDMLRKKAPERSDIYITPASELKKTHATATVKRTSSLLHLKQFINILSIFMKHS